MLSSIIGIGPTASPELLPMVEIENIPPLVILSGVLLLWGVSLFIGLWLIPWVSSEILSKLPPGV